MSCGIDMKETGISKEIKKTTWENYVFNEKTGWELLETIKQEHRDWMVCSCCLSAHFNYEQSRSVSHLIK